MTYTIAKTFTFSAAHHLDGLPEDHPCTRPHGHNYRVDVELAGELDPVGMVMDYRAMGRFKDWVDANLDHRDLNQMVPFNPTAENLAQYLHRVAVTAFPGFQVAAVRVHETDRTVAEYRP